MQQVQDFNGVILPNENFKGKTLIPEHRPEMSVWFMQFGVSTNVAKTNIVERHVFDVERFQSKDKTQGFKKVFTLLKQIPKLLKKEDGICLN